MDMAGFLNQRRGVNKHSTSVSTLCMSFATSCGRMFKIIPGIVELRLGDTDTGTCKKDGETICVGIY